MENGPRLPPKGIIQTLRQFGPGLIISGSIVGSGELIATTTLGSQIGFVALWLIILSCIIKLVVQQELGRYVIVSGETTFQALDKVPGPRWRTSWVVWCWMFMFAAVTLQVGGILGGVGQVFHLAFPFMSASGWTVIVSIVTVVLLFGGRYSYVERASVFMVVSFSFITISCAVMLAWTPYALHLQDVMEGLTFRLPSGGVTVAFAVFGITGVGATELIYYPYWCLEKGYARFVGSNDQSQAWLERARGWIRVMQLDSLMAMFVYTVGTIAFYILGAGVLYGMGKVPIGYEMVRTLSNMYTGTLGSWAFYLFLLGAFFVLYSTTFTGTAANSRVLIDFLELVGFIKRTDELGHWHRVRMAVVFLLSIATTWYLLLGQPVAMIIFGGTAQACMLPVIAFSAIYLRYRRTEPALRPGLMVDLLLWTCTIVMLSFALYRVISFFPMGASRAG